MHTGYEIIQYQQGLSVRISMHRVGHYELHWHKEFELLLILQGTVELTMNGTCHTLQEDDLFLINPGAIHSTSGDKENVIIAIQIDPEFCSKTYPALSSAGFIWPSSPEKSLPNDFCAELRTCVAKMVEEYRLGKPGMTLAIEGLLYQLVLSLVRHVPRQSEKGDSSKNKNENLQRERIIKITEYLHEHYADKITLDELAQKEHLSRHHLSRFFKTQLGISFQDYLHTLRLNKAIKLLPNPKIRISDVALDSGFANVKSFCKVFKDCYGLTPSEYRNRQGLTSFIENSSTYLDFDSLSALEKLRSYLHLANTAPRQQTVDTDICTVRIKGNFRQKGMPLFSRWEQLFSIGRAYDGLRGDVQGHIRQAASELGAKHLRFHGIFSDEMRVVSRNKNGKLVFNWQHVDSFFDFLYEIQVYPLTDLTFMPSCMKSSDAGIFWYKGNISAPSKLEEWVELVHAFVTHCINRYSAEWVRQWYFEIWNEPDYTWVDALTCDYHQFFKATHMALKEIDSQLQVAGPSILHPMGESIWLKQFITYLNQNQLKLDAFTFHIYGEQDYFTHDSNIIPVLGDMNAPKRSIENYYELLSELNLPPAKVLITEFNISVIHKNYLLDTMFAACYVLHSYLQNHHLVQGIIYWTLSDVFEEDPEPLPLFGGNFGMLTSQGIAKPVWYAHWFMHRLGDEILAQGDGYIITKRGSALQILAYNLISYDHFFREGDRSLLKYDDRYGVFEHGQTKNISIYLEGLSGKYQQKSYRLDREHGSAFDLFQKMGMPENMSREEYETLEGLARPSLFLKTVIIKDSFQLEVSLPPHGIQFISLTKWYE